MHQITSLKIIDKVRLILYLALSLSIIIPTYLSLNYLNKPAHAITPPESCFQFDSTAGTITNYYNHENNDNSQPPCPKDVDIPSAIDGHQLQL